jgi:peptide/nickel transport system permease protein
MDNLFIVLSMIAASMPQFWLGLLFILLFAVNLSLLPSHGASTWQGFILPVLTVSLLGTARTLRLVRAQMLDNINADFIRTARAKGATERTVIWKHAFESSSVPIINTIGVRFGSMLGGSTVIESVFAIPGLGSEIVDAIYNKDVPVITGSIIFLTVIYCLIILLVDILQAFADPRIKAKYSS